MERLCNLAKGHPKIKAFPKSFFFPQNFLFSILTHGTISTSVSAQTITSMRMIFQILLAKPDFLPKHQA